MHFLTGASLELTFALIKPDAVRNNDAGQILSKMEDGPYFVADVVSTTWSPQFAMDFYAEHRDKPFFPSLVKFMCSGRLYMVTLVGPNAVADWRARMGATDPEKAEVGTIRSMYGSHDGILMHNAVHGSDSIESAGREVRLVSSNLHRPSRGSIMPRFPDFGEEAYALIEKYKNMKWDNIQERLVPR